MLKKFTDWAKGNGWRIEMSSKPLIVPEFLTKRYDLPAEWLEFISQLENCTNADCTKWFITFDIFDLDSGFRWNEFELISLEAAGDDAAWRDNIVKFWDKHLPIFMSVEGEYEYYAINTASGAVVFGWEPEFEEAEPVAENFQGFIQKIINGEIVL